MSNFKIYECTSCDSGTFAIDDSGTCENPDCKVPLLGMTSSEEICIGPPDDEIIKDHMAVGELVGLGFPNSCSICSEKVIEVIPHVSGSCVAPGCPYEGPPENHSRGKVVCPKCSIFSTRDIPVAKLITEWTKMVHTAREIYRTGQGNCA